VFAYTFRPRTRPTFSTQARQPLSLSQHRGASNVLTRSHGVIHQPHGVVLIQVAQLQRGSQEPSRTIQGQYGVSPSDRSFRAAVLNTGGNSMDCKIFLAGSDFIGLRASDLPELLHHFPPALNLKVAGPALETEVTERTFGREYGDLVSGIKKWLSLEPNWPRPQYWWALEIDPAPEWNERGNPSSESCHAPSHIAPRWFGVLLRASCGLLSNGLFEDLQFAYGPIPKSGDFRSPVVTVRFSGRHDGVPHSLGDPLLRGSLPGDRGPSQRAKAVAAFGHLDGLVKG
jgi:hypothetical protein